MAFNRSRATVIVALDIPKSFNRIWHAGQTNIAIMEFRVRCLFYFVFSNRWLWFWVGSLRKNIQLMLEFFKAPLLVIHFLLYVNYLPDDGICNIDIYDDDTTLYSKCDQASGQC